MSFTQPSLISPEQFMAYNAAWKSMVNGPNAGSLRNYFASSNGLLNYVYLPVSMANEMMASNPASIALGLALTSGASPTFTLAVAGLDSSNYLKTPCYLAGVAGRAAVVSQEAAVVDGLFSPIPPDQAAAWINAWNALSAEGLGASQFDSGYSERLYGFNYQASDFQAALSGAAPTDSLWLNFTLHTTTPQFGTVLTRNQTPTEGSPGTIVLSPGLAYFDMAKPIPPAPPYSPQPRA